ncbi:protein O-GlcNAc transferase protein [Dioscorea alata]|uniref:Protein O-GlcNAc transferase protein n=1 Tax=Dioscorea alata TaxID=55571 RepID=A0ACB7UE23_DIOAL|nr:protein O-GlcNAc transferase protein [Dioscorea alata]
MKTEMKPLRTFAATVKSFKSHARQEPCRITNLLFILSLFLSLSILFLFKSHYCSSPFGKSQTLMNVQVPVKVVNENDDPPLIEDEDEDQEDKNRALINTKTQKAKPICYETSSRSDTCEVEGDVRVQASTNTIFFHPCTSKPQQWRIKPYTRKGDSSALKHVKEWTLKSVMNVEELPQCTKTLTVPAMLFSSQGFTGNFFHDFTDVLIPLFINSYQFHGEVQFLVSDFLSWWVNKFSLILKQLSKYDIVNLEGEEKDVLCYPRLIAGPSFHKELGIDSMKSPNGYSILDFKKLLRQAFGLKRDTVVITKKPKLLIISRKKSREFLNEKEIAQLAMSLGFDVIIGEGRWDITVSKFANLVNSADVMLGVHGAGLTNMVFLPKDAVVIQVIPFGGLEKVARRSFESPTMDMKIKYLDYVIQVNESSLIDQYPKDDPVLKDPMSVHKQGWIALSSLYLGKQNIRIDLQRFRNTLLEAFKLVSNNSSMIHTQ